MATIDVNDDCALAHIAGAIDALIAELERLEEMFSTYRATSEISRLNAGALDVAATSPEVREVLSACAYLERNSNGVFSVHPPEQPHVIDPSGFVKGWATDRAARLLSAAGLEHWCVNVGGDLLTRGRPSPERAWRVAIRDPADEHGIAVVIEAGNRAVATSGAYERGAHVWDGRTGSRPQLIGSLTVVGPQLAWADAFATVGFAMGEAGIEWVAAHDDYEALAITHDGSLLASPGFDALLATE